ncbi:MAG TPA: phosphoserine aminotransferase, partial [Rhodospirillaceae bacterium]|nr:phosphoserine aminotransferase [Rhodospirillaceae bacterium]
LKGLIKRSEANLKVLEAWVAKSSWAAFLAEDAKIRSCTSICLVVKAPFFAKLSADDQAAAAKKIATLLEKEGVALDIGAYRDAPPGLRIWGGATVETADIEKLTPWLDWAFAQVEAEFAAKV